MQTAPSKTPKLPSVAEFMSFYAGADPAIVSFMLPMVLTHGVAYATRYILTERSNRQRFAPLISDYIKAFEAEDTDKGAEIAGKMMDLAESIWKADA
jgi:hypothetical protein